MENAQDGGKFRRRSAFHQQIGFLRRLRDREDRRPDRVEEPSEDLDEDAHEERLGRAVHVGDDQGRRRQVVEDRSPHDGGAVFGHFDRDPLGLYPELAEIGWAATPLPCDGGSALLRLQRLPPP